jgi:signal transduction histidine kinase
MPESGNNLPEKKFLLYQINPFPLRNKFTYPALFFGILLVAATVFYALFEWQSDPDYSEEALLEQMHESLDTAVKLYDDNFRRFVDDSDSLFEQVAPLTLTSQNLSFINNLFNSYDFWGISLHGDRQRKVWSGYSLSPVPIPIAGEQQSVRVSLLKRNNVTYFFGQRIYDIDDERHYLLTARKLELTSNLPFADQVTYRLSDDPALTGMYPVTYNFFDDLPDNAIYRKLSTDISDSVGVVFASPDDIPGFIEMKEDLRGTQRTVYQLVLFGIAFILIVIWSSSRLHPYVHLLQLLIVSAGWYLMFQSGLITYWSMMLTEMLSSYDYTTIFSTTVYLIHSLFLLLISQILYHFFKFRKSKEQNAYVYRTLLLSIVFGAASVWLMLFFITATAHTLIDGSIPLLDLELAPDPISFFFYISSAIFFTATAIIIVSAGYALYKLEDDKSAIIAVTSLFSFLLFFFLSDLLLLEQPLFNWIFLLSGILFLILLWLIHSVHKHIGYFTEMSGFRKLMVGVFLASSTVYVVIWNTSNDRMDRELLERADAFANEQITDSRDVLFTLLTRLEQELILFTEEDILGSTAMTQARFQRAIRSSIGDEWRNHSFEIQLLNTDGEQIGDFSTNLDTPGWRSLVDIDLMKTSHSAEQIRRATNRPIIWGRPPNIGENFVSFNRGWIPIYDDTRTNDIIAWIFAAAYIERPDYNKPMRAVLAAATTDDWKQSYYLAEFSGDRMIRNAMQGIYSNQPEYNRLPPREAEIARRDSVAFLTNVTAQGAFREILLKSGDNRFIKASTPLPGFNHHLFSYFRLQIVMVFFGLFIFSILAVAGQDKFSLFGQSRKFRHRLLDGLTLATILFLTVLIFATQYAVSNQNEKNVERELITKLNSLGDSLRGEIDVTAGHSYSTRLNEFASPLNVDAILYLGSELRDSTTPQIFQQHLMPRYMPYHVYDFLFNRERRHYLSTAQIGNETLLIGYRALLDNENRPFAAVAIPTFVQSPVYREQLLETTSYLFGVYLIIFAFFIVGTVFFSNRLTKPLQIIQSGLNKISRGDMKTRVEVTSRDEIGTLAKAYNEMVERLEDARSELVRAEREAAWKEMAQQVAHEIKNPLTPMKLNLQHLQRQLAANPENVMELKPMIERTANNVIEQIESLNKIASDFSKFAKPVRDTLQPVNLTRLVSSVAGLYMNDNGVSVEVNQPEQPIAVMAVEDELRRALINLIKNGIEAHNGETASITITVKREGKCAEIRISDSGEGIAEEDRDKIFVPNFSTKSSGTGLGLAITKKILEAHHAEISFESETGTGSTFVISIPVMNK